MLTRNAKDADARLRLGLALALSGRTEAAIEQWQQVLQARPGDFATLVNLGAALAQRGRHDAAITHLHAALAIDAAQAQVHYNLGNSLLATQDIDGAISSLRHAIALDARLPPAHNNLGVAYRRAGRLAQACSEFTAAIALDPHFVDARNNLADTLYAHGVELHRAGELPEAVVAYDRMLAMRPEAADAWRDRGRVLESLQRLDSALASYQRALQLKPDDLGALAGMLSCCVRSCLWAPVADTLQRLRGAASGFEALHPFLALSISDLPAEQLLISAARARASIQVPIHVPVATVEPAPDGRGRIRLAYVSSDLRDHAISHLLIGVLERHDRDRYEVHAVALQADTGHSEIGARLRRAVQHYHDVTALGDAAVAQRMRDCGIDVAVDLNGYTTGARPGIFAHRAAPVQVNYLGYAGTLGAPYMDYLIADEVVIPAGHEQWYSEQVVRLPHCYLPNDDQREIAPAPSRAQAGLPPEGLVLCAFGNAYKINPPVFDIWMRLLRERPGSVLWLRGIAAEACANLRREAGSRGVDAARLVFAPQVASMAEHLGRQGLADLYLDTYPYNAHSTACDMLWAGVPVLTCAGASFASRVAASALTAVGLPELITHSLSEYERLALELTGQPGALPALCARLAQNRTGAPLFDTQGYTRALERAYASMHQRQQHESAAAAWRVD
jgi:predicted O-linked N-acetylglucosamine transferase (SPINDLY family)